MKTGDTVVMSSVACSAPYHAIILEIAGKTLRVKIKCTGSIRFITFDKVINR